MNAKQKQFCVEYWQSKNATQAAIKAGYSARTAYSSGNRLLKKDEVQKELKSYEQQGCLRINIRKDQVGESVKAIAEDPHETTKDRLRAYELLCKMYGFTAAEKIEVKGQVDTTVSKLDGILKQLQGND
mgnify:FL=1